jgi:hypothetical protein
MKDGITDNDVVMLLDNKDVPEQLGTDPFEDAVTEEIVMLDVVRLDPIEIELL